MREVIAGEHPVGIHGAEVLNLELDQGAGQLRLVSEVLREGISLELKTAAQDVHEQLDESVHGAQHIREQEEADDDGLLGQEAKVCVQRVVVDEDREQSEYVEEVDLSGVQCERMPLGRRRSSISL